MMMRLLTLTFAVAAAHDYAADVEDARCDVDATTTMNGKFVWQPVFAAIETDRPEALRILACAFREHRATAA